MKYFAIIASIIILTSVPMVSVAANSYPSWYFTGATLNYTAYQYYGLNMTIPNMIWNFSYKITYTMNEYFNYIYYKKIGKNSTVINGNGTLNDPDGFPALNNTDLNLLNHGNASFFSIISIPGIKNIKVKTNITVTTFSGTVLSDEIIYKFQSLLGEEKIYYLNYSQYSGVLLNEKSINIMDKNITKNYFIIIYTNIALSKVTLVQVFVEFTIAIVFVIALLYFFKRYRKVNYK